MLDIDEVMRKMVEASKSEGTFVSCVKMFDDVFVLRDEAAGVFLVWYRGNFIEIYGKTNKIEHMIIDTNDLDCFINSVIYDIDPYLG